MWYLAEVLFAEPQLGGRVTYHCESCNVLLSAATATEAYDWGRVYASEPPAAMALLGVSHLTTIGDELRDGIEICGHFFEQPDVWSRIGKLVPPAGQTEAERWERGQDTRVGELLSAEQITQLRRRLGDRAVE